MSQRLFVSGTGTGVGKTWVTRGLARALSLRGARVVALKPVETGCAPDALDAIALARACGAPALASVPGFYRARAPLAPYAATLEGEPALDMERLVEAIASVLPAEGIALIEGAGGLLVPLDAERDMADLAVAIRARVLLVGRDRLGVLSDVLAAHQAALARGLEVAAVVLVEAQPDASHGTNARILRERLGCPLVSFSSCPDDDGALALAAAPVARALFIE